MSIVGIGTDVSSTWKFKDGDIVLVDDDDNICQCVHNRLNNLYDSLSDFYTEYGSMITYFLGWKKTDELLRFMEAEIRTSLLQDPRLQDLTVDLEYDADGVVNGFISLSYDDDSDLSLSLVLGYLGVDVELEEGEL